MAQIKDQIEEHGVPDGTEGRDWSAAPQRLQDTEPARRFAIGGGWEELIELLRRVNRLREFCVLWHCPTVSFDASWDDPERFSRQFEIWTTTYALAPSERMAIREGHEFRVDRYTRPGKLLSLHSQVVTEEGCRFFLMLDLLAPHDMLDRVITYLDALLSAAGVGGGGYVIRTSRSFHFIGRECVDASRYRKVLEMVLKSGGGNGIVDVGYCAHTLARDLETGLRVQPAGPQERLEVVAELLERERPCSSGSPWRLCRSPIAR